MLKRVLMVACLGLLVSLGISQPASATVIGDLVTFQCTNCGPPTLDSFTVLDGSPELTLFSQFQVDVEDDYLQINWIFSSNSIISDLNFLWTSLDFGTPIIGVSIDPSSTWGASPAVTLSFTDSSVNLVNNADLTVVPGDFLRINVDTSPVPEPGTMTMLALGIAGLAARRRRSHPGV